MTGKILLVNPPKEALIVPVNSTFQRSIPVGLSMVAASLREANYKPEIFDSIIYLEDSKPVQYLQPKQKRLAESPYHSSIFHIGASWERIRAKILKSKPDLVGIASPMSTHCVEAYKIAQIVKDVAPDTPTVLGGAHPTDLPHEALSNPYVDFVVMGEAEHSFVELSNAILNGGGLKNIDGIGFKKNGNNKVNPKTKFIEDLDQLPFAALDLLPLERWFKKIGYKYTMLNTSRGCPFNCEFCSIHSVFGHKYRSKTPEKTFEEIAWYNEQFGIDHFLIEDDNFTFNLERTNKLCDLLVQSGLNLSFYALQGISAVRVNEKLLSKLKKAGFKDVSFSLESSNEEVKNKINKPVAKTDILNAVALSKKIGFDNISVFIMAGLPGQTLDNILKDVDFVMEQAVIPKLNPYYPIPNTPLYDECLEKGYFERDNLYILRGEYAPTNTPKLSREALNELLQSFFAMRLVQRCYKAGGELSETGLIGNLLYSKLAREVSVKDDEITIVMQNCDCKDIKAKNGKKHCKVVAERLARAFSLASNRFYKGEETQCNLKGICTFKIYESDVDKNQEYIIEKLRHSLRKHMEVKSWHQP